MRKYEKPCFHPTDHIGPLGNEQIAALSSAEPEAHLSENGYRESTKLYRANGNYVYRKIAGEGVLIPSGDLPGNVMVTVSETCGFLWAQLQEPKTIGDLIAAAKAAYDDPNHELEAQIREFVEDRVKTGHIWEVR